VDVRRSVPGYGDLIATKSGDNRLWGTERIIGDRRNMPGPSIC